MAATNAEHTEPQFDLPASADASQTYPAQANCLKKNGFVILKGRPCKIVELSSSKPGKHGHAKVKVTGIDIFTGNKIEDVFPASHNVDVPNVYRCEYILVFKGRDGFLNLLRPTTGEEKQDVSVETAGAEVKAKLGRFLKEKKQVSVVVQGAMGRESVVDVKGDKD